MLLAQQQQRSAQKFVRHSPRCPTYPRNSTERREDVRSKRHGIEVRGAVKPARVIAHDEASSAGLSQCADLENWLKDHQRCRAVPITVSSTLLFGMTWLVLSNETLCSPNRLKAASPCAKTARWIENPPRWVDGACSSVQGEPRSAHELLLFSVALIRLVRARRGASCLARRARAPAN